MITGWIEERKILWPVYQNYNKTLERTSIIEFNCGRSWKMTENDIYEKVKRKKMLSLCDRLQVILKFSWLLTMQNDKKVLEKVLKRRGIQRGTNVNYLIFDPQLNSSHANSICRFYLTVQMWLPPKPSHNVPSALSPRDKEVRTTFRFKSNQLLIASGRKIACLRDNSTQHSYRKTAGCTFIWKTQHQPELVSRTILNEIWMSSDVFGHFRMTWDKYQHFWNAPEYLRQFFGFTRVWEIREIWRRELCWNLLLESAF